MERKKMTIRFDLDHPEDRRAWEYLQRLNPASMNRAVIAIIDKAERNGEMRDVLRSVIREELNSSLERLPVQTPQTEPEPDDGMTDTIMEFLESFS